MPKYKVSWDDCTGEGRNVDFIVEATSREHAFAKLLANTLYQNSMILFLTENNIDLDPAARFALEWEVLKDE